MKKLEKLSINPEKVIKNEELVNLRGGYDLGCYKCCDGNNCSSCYHSYSTATCAVGTLTKCDSSETCYYHG